MARADHREVEIKRLLSGEDAAGELVAALGARVRAEKRQVNHVFDTDDGRLRRSLYTLRLRTEDGAAYVTAKGPGRSVSARTKSRLEAETAADAADVDELLDGRIDALCVLRRAVRDEAYDELWQGIDEARACRPLRAIASFENLRRVVAVTLPSGLELEVEVDRTSFPGARIDSEVEIEVPGEDRVVEVEQWLDAIARDAGIELRDSSPKIARFREALERADSAG